MRRRELWVMLTIAGVLACAQHSVAADAPKPKPKLLGEPKVLGGVELGVFGGLSPLRDYAKTGGSFSPYLAYKYNRLVGIMGNLHILGIPNRDRPDLLDDDATWIAGATAGPRIDIPISEVEVYGTFQAGVYSGLAPHSPVTHTSWGYNGGGGMSLPILFPGLRFGLFGKYHYLDQHAHGEGHARFVTGGINIEYNFSHKAPPVPTPKPVAQAAAATPPVATGKKIVLRGVNFDFDKSNIRTDARPILDEAINTLKAEGTITIVCEGHTDSVGSDQYNQKLSFSRANAVKDYLVKGGVPGERIKVEGLGESKPVASNDTADGRAQNRRVELRVADK